MDREFFFLFFNRGTLLLDPLVNTTFTQYKTLQSQLPVIHYSDPVQPKGHRTVLVYVTVYVLLRNIIPELHTPCDCLALDLFLIPIK